MIHSRFFLLVFYLGTAITLSAQQWIPRADFPGGQRDDAVAFVIGSYAYIGTGRDIGFTCRSDFYRYDPRTDQWNNISDIPSARQYACAFVIEEKAYVFGGIDNAGNFLNDGFVYDPVTDSWTSCSPIPGIGRLSSAAVGDGYFGYLIGGRNGNNYLNEVWRYNPAEDQWTAMNDFPGGARSEMNVTSIGARIYAGMGVDSNWQCFHDWWEYVYAEDSWQQRSAFPGEACFYSVYADNGLVGAGIDTSLNYQRKYYHYSVVQEAWKEWPELNYHALKGMSGFFIAGSYFVTTGIDSANQRQNHTFQLRVTDQTGQIITALPSYSDHLLELYGEGIAMGNTIRIYNLSGQLLYSGKITTDLFYTRIEMPQLAKGFYVYQLLSNDNKIMTSGKWYCY